MKNIKAEEFDKKFNEGEDVTEYLNLQDIRKPLLTTKRVNVDFPQWMIDSLDKESKRIGVPRQAIIKIWIAERLERPLVEVS